MSANLRCRKCGVDLEDFNFTDCQRIFYCPHCGTRLLKKQREALLRKVTNDEIDGMIKDRLLDMLQECDGNEVSADELAERAWEKERCDGVVFYYNYTADRFVMRHRQWVDEALEYAVDAYGDSESYMQMKAACNDQFLVVAFILATEHFLYDQLDISRNLKKLTKKRIAEIKRLVKTTAYDGDF